MPEWPVASIVSLEIDAKSVPEGPFDGGGGGAKAIRAMPKCPLREFQWGFPDQTHNLRGGERTFCVVNYNIYPRNT